MRCPQDSVIEIRYRIEIPVYRNGLFLFDAVKLSPQIIKTEFREFTKQVVLPEELCRYVALFRPGQQDFPVARRLFPLDAGKPERNEPQAWTRSPSGSTKWGKRMRMGMRTPSTRSAACKTAPWRARPPETRPSPM